MSDSCAMCGGRLAKKTAAGHSCRKAKSMFHQKHGKYGAAWKIADRTRAGKAPHTRWATAGCMAVCTHISTDCWLIQHA